MLLTLEPLLSRAELLAEIDKTPAKVGHRQFEAIIPLLPYVVLPGQTRKRYRLSSVLAFFAALPEVQPQQATSLHRRRQRQSA